MDKCDAYKDAYYSLNQLQTSIDLSLGHCSGEEQDLRIVVIKSGNLSSLDECIYVDIADYVWMAF